MSELKIPDDLKKRYEILASYKPMEVAVTDIYVRDYLALIERIARLEAMRTHCERCGADYMATGIEAGCPCLLIAERDELKRENKAMLQWATLHLTPLQINAMTGDMLAVRVKGTEE